MNTPPPVADPAPTAPWVRLPTAHGLFEARVFSVGDQDHLVLRQGALGGARPVLLRLHSECLTGDALGSLRCDCGAQLEQALIQLAQAEAGVLIYLRGHEGRGIGLKAKLAAYALQDRGLDTVEANLHLGLPVDARSYEAAAEILAQLGVTQVRLLTNNPDKIAQLDRAPLQVLERVPLDLPPHPENRHYLDTKRLRLGHLLEPDPLG